MTSFSYVYMQIFASWTVYLYGNLKKNSLKDARVGLIYKENSILRLHLNDI